MTDFSFAWAVLLTNLLKMGIAFLLAVPIAWQRERSTRIMGLRTFPLTAVACCGYVLVAIEILGPTAEPQARIIQGLMSGLGFLGAGAILKDGSTVQGTATAASVWTTGALAAAVAYGHYEIAVLLSLITFLTLFFLTSSAAEQVEADKERT